MFTVVLFFLLLGGSCSQLRSENLFRSFYDIYNEAPRRGSTPAAPPSHAVNSFSSAFIRAADRFYNAIDYQAKPCDDFYQYACGNWVKNAQLSYGRTSKSAMFDTSHDVLKDMIEIYTEKEDSNSTIINGLKLAYRKCMDEGEDRVGYLLRRVNALGGWPMVDNCTASKNVHFTRAELTDLVIKMRDVAFISVSVEVDLSNAVGDHDHKLQVGAPSNMDGQHVYVDPKKYPNQVRAIKNYMFEKISLLKTDYEQKKHAAISRGVTMQEIDEIFDLERKIVKARRTAGSGFVSIVDLEHLFGRVDWRKVIESAVGNRSIRRRLVYASTGYLGALDKIFATTDARILKNYLFWNYMKVEFLEKYQLDSRYTKVEEIYTAYSKSRIVNQPRDMACATVLNWFMDRPIHATSAMYARKHVSQGVLDEFEKMRVNIENELLRILDENPWLSDANREISKAKIREMIMNIAYPRWVMDDEMLDAYYEKLEITEDDSYSRILEKIADFMNWEQMEKLDKKFNRNDFMYPASFVNGNHHELANSMQLPAGMFRFPFFGLDQPKAINYAMLGMVIAHEYTHTFDKKGMLYDQFGNMVDWWDKKSRAEFDNRTECLVEQYFKYPIESTNLFNNGNFTLSENIADSGGVKTAYRAYMRWLQTNDDTLIPRAEHLSHEQTFFVAFAQYYCSKNTLYDKIERWNWDNHTPDKYRVIGTLSNLPEFAKAFNCPAGSSMAPKKRCAVW